MTWIVNSEKRALIANGLAKASLRIHEVPDFRFYAIADGIGNVLARCGKWTGLCEDEPAQSPDLFDFFGCDSD